MWTIVIGFIILLGLILKYLNHEYFLLAGCKRVKTVDGSDLETKVYVKPGETIFGNNLDVIGATPESVFQYVRKLVKMANGKSFLLYFLFSPVYSITNAKDAEEVLQSQALIEKSNIYTLIKPFIGEGLLTNTDRLWHFRRKLLTPAFHFNILQTFMEVFKEESVKIIEILKQKPNGVVTLIDVIPQFTLNSLCAHLMKCPPIIPPYANGLFHKKLLHSKETALGIKLDDIPGSIYYRNAVNALEPILINRLCNPILFFDVIYKFTSGYRKQTELLNITHNFSSQIIEKKREEFKKRKDKGTAEKVNEYGRKQRYAMLDTLLEAELKGQIDHQGICDEVNTFMFAGYETTSACLMFSLVNLAIYQDIQQKCFEEIQCLAPLENLSVFDFNQLEYLECVIKETLRIMPSVPFLARGTTQETVINGLVLPSNANIHIHTYDIMRDELYFPEPNKFDPERFRPENTTHRHPFAFIPFSAGPRNCIGQKFAMLEMKVLLVSVLRNFSLQPITKLDEITFENGLVLRTKEKLQIRVVPRVNE